MSKPFADYLYADYRLAMLRLLCEAPGYTRNSSVLAKQMDFIGNQVSRDWVRTQLRWLEEQQVVTITEDVPGLLVAKLTERGQDVADGRATVPGIARPGA